MSHLDLLSVDDYSGIDSQIAFIDNMISNENTGAIVADQSMQYIQPAGIGDQSSFNPYSTVGEHVRQGVQNSYDQSGFEFAVPGDVSYNHLMSDPAELMDLQSASSLQVMAGGVPRYPLTSAYAEARSAPDPTEFFNKLESLYSDENDDTHYGTYQHLKTHFPSLRKKIAERFEEWKRNPNGFRTYLSQKIEQLSPADSQITDFGDFDDVEFDQSSASETQIPTPTSRVRPSREGKRAGPKLVPRLKTVPRQRGDHTCSGCQRRLVINGKNDGIL